MLIFKQLGFKANIDYTADDIEIVKHVATLIGYRAAQLISINTALLLKKIDESNVTIAIDGSVYKFHPRIKAWLEHLIPQLAPGKKVKFKFKLL